MTVHPGQMLSHYRLEKKIGEGAGSSCQARENTQINFGKFDDMSGS